MENTEKNAKNEIMKILGNQILQFEKNLLRNTEVNSIYIENNTNKMIDKILVMLSQVNSKQYANYYKIYNNKELSKQAKKEKMLDKKIKSNFEWESDVK